MCIRDRDYMIDVKRPVRFVLATEYGIKNDDMLYGFLSGALSQNYDIEAIYVDALVRITQKTAEQLEGFFNCLEKLGEEHNVKFVLNVGADKMCIRDSGMHKCYRNSIDGHIV